MFLYIYYLETFSDKNLICNTPYTIQIYKIQFKLLGVHSPWLSRKRKVLTYFLYDQYLDHKKDPHEEQTLILNLRFFTTIKVKSDLQIF